MEMQTRWSSRFEESPSRFHDRLRPIFVGRKGLKVWIVKPCNQSVERPLIESIANQSKSSLLEPFKSNLLSCWRPLNIIPRKRSSIGDSVILGVSLGGDGHQPPRRLLQAQFLRLYLFSIFHTWALFSNPFFLCITLVPFCKSKRMWECRQSRRQAPEGSERRVTLTSKQIRHISGSLYSMLLVGSLSCHIKYA